MYDSGRVRHTTRWHLPLPDAAGTHRYLAHTLAATLEALDALPADATHDALYFFRLAALHEMMHAEAAAYMARTLGLALPEPEPPRLPGEAEDLIVPAQRITLGASRAGFAFDNELQAETLDLPAFRIDAHAVSWARFLPFLEAGGYEQTQWWSEAGKDWLHTQPAPWRRDADGRWLQRRGPQWCTVNLQHAAVHLSAHEAEAWCRWAGRRLPTEAEWECAARSAPGFAWGAAWEWTASAFAPRAGFEAHPYRDYSAPWFHTRRTLKGACPATSPWLAHGSYRNFFEPHRRDVFAGFRSAA